VSQCSGCSSDKLCCLRNEQGSNAIQSEYEPTRAGGGFTEEPEALPGSATALKAASPGDPRSAHKANPSSLPSAIEYVPDDKERQAAAAIATGRADAPSPGGQSASPTPLAAASPGGLAAEVVHRLQTALDTACSDIRELETLLEEARQAEVEVPEVAGLKRRVRALRAIEGINQAALKRNEEKLSKSIEEARAAGVPDNQLTKAVQALETIRADRRKRQEEEKRRAEIRRREVAAACLRQAQEERDMEKLVQAIDGAQREGVDEKSVEVASKLLADLRAESEKKGKSSFFSGRKKK